MNREDFVSWLDRPLTNTDYMIIDTLLDIIKNYDSKNDEVIKLLLKIEQLEKEIKIFNKEEIEKLEV